MCLFGQKAFCGYLAKVARRLVYLLVIFSYLNVLTLVQGTCAGLAPKMDVSAEASIGTHSCGAYGSIWEILLSNILEQKDAEHPSCDCPICTHCFIPKNTTDRLRFPVLGPLKNDSHPVGTAGLSIPTNARPFYNSRNAHAQYHDYLFRLTPF